MAQKAGTLLKGTVEYGRMGLSDRTDFMDMFQKQISDMKLLSQKKAGAYHQYLTEERQGRLPRFSGRLENQGAEAVLNGGGAKKNGGTFMAKWEKANVGNKWVFSYQHSALS